MPAPIHPLRDRAFYLPDAEATAALAARMAPYVGPGRVLLLVGDIGAGKSHFARALIHARSGPIDVPSPTYTLVQTYPDPEAEIWHADLYRLGDPDECLELGLTEAFETAFCMIEWPDRLGDLSPEGALTLTLEQEGEGRRGRFAWRNPDWDEVVDALGA
ncbi:tRNA threonylcarbamoyladenosine biosynthesis protein TsaE [Poseidonocella pacifica]|uniref:tRNA threonylcarbamoyladenosine biosynthesis protein TsaE n=1 Tax=Poseidonocella pacifica TaxID=871651 RepID=A0A1I0XU64_9RHOB|nr:tRNA (adenosine(37)-N6)-threonylcarbamoyltransferase complex ATPase subunit type 1 TsaE [Poseidonocella pacifica]SFB04542.1 tRNA threonylcarbamoyladenosine biosynthesis protein TsaE [Poseidonocella pacifica]